MLTHLRDSPRAAFDSLRRTDDSRACAQSGHEVEDHFGDGTRLVGFNLYWTVVASAAQSKPKLYNPRHPERTLLYRTVCESCAARALRAPGVMTVGMTTLSPSPARVVGSVRRATLGAW